MSKLPNKTNFKSSGQFYDIRYEVNLLCSKHAPFQPAYYVHLLNATEACFFFPLSY